MSGSTLKCTSAISLLALQGGAAFALDERALREEGDRRSPRAVVGLAGDLERPAEYCRTSTVELVLVRGGVLWGGWP